MEMTGATVRCSRCRRILRTATSRAAGIGPRCAAIEAAFNGLSDKQRDKARQLIVDGGVTRTSRKGIARVPSDETGEHYLTSVTGHCTCKWGLHRKSATAKTCYHVPVRAAGVPPAPPPGPDPVHPRRLTRKGARPAMNAAYQPTVTMQAPAVRPVRREEQPLTRVVARRADRLLSPNINPNNGRHAQWCPCLPGYVCADHRLTR